MKEWVAYLTKEIKKHIEGGVIIWYDSIINTG